jgi:hypothetical protein
MQIMLTFYHTIVCQQQMSCILGAAEAFDASLMLVTCLSERNGLLILCEN